MDTISRIWKYGLLQYLFHSSRQLYDCFVPCAHLKSNSINTSEKAVKAQVKTTLTLRRRNNSHLLYYHE